MEYVAYEARMNTPVLDKEGGVKGCVRDELKVLWQKQPERYEPPPEVPPEVEHLWHWYLELRGACGESIEWSSIDAWARRMDIEPEPHEVSALLAIDAKYRSPKKAEPWT